MLRRHRGFSLLELLVVLAILAMTYALVPPLFNIGGSGTELKGAARHLAAALRRAQSHSIASRGEAAVTLDLSARAYAISGDSRTYRLPEAAAVKVYTAASEVVEGDKAAIRFYPDGSSTGGRVTLTAAGRDLLVDVDWLTGRVQILEQP